jgi:hypothetical protein
MLNHKDTAGITSFGRKKVAYSGDPSLPFSVLGAILGANPLPL